MVKEAIKLYGWTTALCLWVVVWLTTNTELTIDYSRHPQLIDSETGIHRKPSELLDLTRLINITDEYIESTNSMERLHNLEYTMNFENPFITDQSYSVKQQLDDSGLPVSNQQKCGQHLDWILSKLETHPDYPLLKGRLGLELTQLMDTFGKPEAGLFSGVVTWPGSYKSCLRTQLDHGRIQTGRYCFARLKPKSWPHNETIMPQTAIRMAICLPESCDTNSYLAHGKKLERLVKMEITGFLENQLDLTSVNCLPDERSPVRRMPWSGHLLVWMILGWLALVALGSVAYELSPRKRQIKSLLPTAKDYGGSNQLGQFDVGKTDDCQPDANTTQVIIMEVLDALSIRSSIKTFKTNLFKVRHNEGHRVRVNIAAIDFFKVCMTLLVIFGHSAYLSLVFTRRLSNKLELGTSETGRMAMSISRVVDTFFLFFGLLFSYTIMRKLNRHQIGSPSIWFATNIGIIARVAPMFMMVYWYSKLVSPYNGAGPWWDYGIDHNSMRGVCMRDPWWKAIPYLGSLGSPSVPTCNLPGWFIVSYSQIALLLPIITYLLVAYRSYIARFSLVFFLLAASTIHISIRMYKQTSVDAKGLSLYGGFLANLLEKFESTGHMMTLGRLGPASVGCIIGFICHQYEERNIEKLPRIFASKYVILFLSLTHLFIIMMPMFGHRLTGFTGQTPTLEQIVAANAITQFLWPIMNGYLAISLTTVFNNTVIVRFCAHSIWHVINRLGFAIYLIHWEIIFVILTSFDTAPSYGFVAEVFRVWTMAAFFSICIALVIHITFETPLAKIVMIVARASITKLRVDCNEEPLSSISTTRLSEKPQNGIQVSA